MTSLQIPQQLRELLMDTPLEAPTLQLVEVVGEILTDNKMPFFPAYTDHGAAHVTDVLAASVKLIPAGVWKKRLLGSADAAVLTCAICLHDLALHLREPGFVELIGDSSRFKPLHWFDIDRPARAADRPWPALWQAFRNEARNFTQSQLDRLLGPSDATVPGIAFGDTDTEPNRWTQADLLLIGEFIRRHHARLSHEIAIHGFPGCQVDEFPALFPVLSKTLPELADAIGAVARSHNEELRVASNYLEFRNPGNRRPDGAVLLYLMGLLRVADYFQLQARRVPPLLLHLRDPHSPQSLDEWAKHQAIQEISWENQDPHAVYIQVRRVDGLRTYLQLEELIADLQSELDVTTAVLDETYGESNLAPLKLSRQRVRTNLSEPSLHDDLSFVPQRARLRSAEDLFRLVISNLYGDQPAVAGRELVQNAVDAVRERHHWQARTGHQPQESQFRSLPADVLVEIQEAEDGPSLLRVIDRGIGMTPTTIVESFLTAGATFGLSRTDEGQLDPATAIRWMKAGRFGVGVFAAFLLGSEVRVTTRHIDAKRGVSFVARLDDDLVQLNWADDAPLGTEIDIPFSTDALLSSESISRAPAQLHTLLIEQIARFYFLVSPGVVYRVVRPDGKIITFNIRGEIPTPGRRLPNDWRSVSVSGFDAVLWQTPTHSYTSTVAFLEREDTFNGGQVAHNGIVIREVAEPRHNRLPAYHWSNPTTEEFIAPVSVAVFDTRHLFGVSLNRYQLTHASLPFEDALLRSIGTDIVAHALACEPSAHPLAKEWGLQPAFSRRHWLPFLPDLLELYCGRDLCVLWTRDSKPRLHASLSSTNQALAGFGETCRSA